MENLPNDTPKQLQHARDGWHHRPTIHRESRPRPGIGVGLPTAPSGSTRPRAVEVAQAEGPVASTNRSVRVLETSHPPAFYLPPESVIPGRLVRAPGSSHCEWNGVAEYLAVSSSDRRTSIWLRLVCDSLVAG